MDTGPLPETCCPDPAATIWIRLGQAVYRGPSLRLDPHSGSVDCLAVGLDQPFTLCADGIGERKSRSALIPARTRHQIIADGQILFYYLDPHTALANHLRGRMREHTPIAHFDHPDEQDLIRHFQRDIAPDPDTLFALLGTPGAGQVDERIRTALDIMRAHPENQCGAAEIAAQVHLSTSRFLHLFAAHTRTSFRQYRLWTRMLRMAAAIAAGQDLTTAANAVGFASAAHFSTSFHRMFGLNASTLLAGGTRIVLAAAEEVAG
ncbi:MULTISPECIES: AraC family transcriptional regulator [unclassified Crossiella]|uniref:helix-turn-helix domain-containing protein n=1 Tax=unclassified Crossiella TaxID=2620835 RepID=UPI001FFEDCBB|nr:MULTISPECIES: AraC family transcriptional regulator [unclassified Crossiella]MCK2245062.1 AraC family transcriptional regulator [Crossiella sp. S99.2]MCK2258643.1 AraC family transcriptional regulator [Crossiella sp. S99.1]